MSFILVDCLRGQELMYFVSCSTAVALPGISRLEPAENVNQPRQADGLKGILGENLSPGSPLREG